MKFLWLLVPGLFLLTIRSVAGELRFDDYKCRIVLSGGWERVPNVTQTDPKAAKSIILSAVDSTHTRSLVLVVVPMPRNLTMTDSSVVNELMRSFVRPPTRMLSHSALNVTGVPAMKLSIELPGPKHLMYRSLEFLLCNGFLYTLMSVDSVGRDPGEDAGLQQIISSFGFIGTPELHGAPGTSSEKKIWLPKCKIGLTLPDGWRARKPEEMFDQSETFEVASSDDRLNISINALSQGKGEMDLHEKDAIQMFERRFVSKGFVVTDRQPIFVAGHKAIQFETTLSADNLIQSETVIIVGNGSWLYVVSGYVLQDDVPGHAEIERILKSIRFTKGK
jgi:hypothetical protein